MFAFASIDMESHLKWEIKVESTFKMRGDNFRCFGGTYVDRRILFFAFYSFFWDFRLFLGWVKHLKGNVKVFFIHTRTIPMKWFLINIKHAYVCGSIDFCIMYIYASSRTEVNWSKCNGFGWCISYDLHSYISNYDSSAPVLTFCFCFFSSPSSIFSWCSCHC